MSQHLAHLLGRPPTATAGVISKLESLSGHSSQDVRLLAGIKAGLHGKLSQLGLNPHDTTGQELHFSLLARLQKDIDQFERAMGRATNDEDSYMRALVKLIEHRLQSYHVWVLKKTVAKDLLRQQPPRRLMKSLGYRSAQSMLKREDIGAIYAAIPLIESNSFLKRLYSGYATLRADHFESRPLEIINLSGRRWQSLPGPRPPVKGVPELGAAAFWRSPGSGRQAGFLLVSLLLPVIEDLRLRSLSFKLQQFKADFGKHLIKGLYNHLPAAVVAGESIPWRTLHRHYSQQPVHKLPAFFEPHIQLDDLHLPTLSELLTSAHPTFRWWATNEHLGLASKRSSVSLNFQDTLYNFLHQPPYRQASRQHFQQRLWDELISRYLNYKGVENYIIKQLDGSSLALEAVSFGQSPAELPVKDQPALA